MRSPDSKPIRAVAQCLEASRYRNRRVLDAGRPANEAQDDPRQARCHGRSGHPQKRHAWHTHGDTRGDPRLTRAADVCDGAHGRRPDSDEQRGDRAGVAPQSLPSHGVRHHDAREVGRKHKQRDQAGVGPPGRVDEDPPDASRKRGSWDRRRDRNRHRGVVLIHLQDAIHLRWFMLNSLRRLWLRARCGDLVAVRVTWIRGTCEFRFRHRHCRCRRLRVLRRRRTETAGRQGLRWS